MTLMTDEERVKWEWRRHGGKRRFLLRNMLAYTGVIVIPYLFIQLSEHIFERPVTGWLWHVLGLGGFIAVTVASASWALLDTKWNRNERAYQASLKAGTSEIAL